jgi:diguanylate cyclase (GGDEF)-like protein/PAS domain S-box-containing protein
MKEVEISEKNLEVREERFSLAMQATQDGLWDLNFETNETYWSPRWKSILGYAEHELEPGLLGFIELLHPEDKKTHEHIMGQISDKLEVEFRMKHKLGHYVDILSKAIAVRKSSSGQIVRIVGTHIDVTERNRATELIEESERRFRTLYDDSPAMFLTLDNEATILFINKYGADHLGYTVDSLIGKSILNIMHDDDAKLFVQKLGKCSIRSNKVQRCEVRKIHKYGENIWLRATMRSIGEENGYQNVLVTCEDITEARILSEKLEYQAKHDALTGLINRAEFENRLRRVLNAETASSVHALCYLDLDRFKVINDTSGHLAGDELLRRVSDILNTVVRKRDTLARMGGDEFAVLLEHCPLEQAERVANELLRSIETLRFEWEGKPYSLGVSIGLVPIQKNSDTLTDILSAADAACYAAKDSGRNRVKVFYSDDIELSRRRSEMGWISKINLALEEGRFCLEKQRISLLDKKAEDKRGNHFEILLRMKTDNGKMIYPGAFLPAAERYDLMGAIDRWVVKTTLNWLSTDLNELDNLAICTVNLSGQSLGDKEFLSFLLFEFEQSKIPPEKICFEVTETATIANLGSAIEFIKELKDIGCLFSLDDFGAGVSSFTYLKNLPVDFLKIDGAFIKEIDKDPVDLAMVRSINEIAQVLGKLTIAEFVENNEILEVMKDIKVDYVQGYVIGKPELIKSIV